MNRSELPKVLAVSGSPKQLQLPAAVVISADAYLRGELPPLDEHPIVLNLCRKIGYLTRGYYVSLLAEGRGHTVYPTVHDMEAAANPIACLRTLTAGGVPTAAPRRWRKGPKPREPEVVAVATGQDEKPYTFQAEESGGQVVLKQSEMESASVLVVLGRTIDPRFRKLAASVYREFPLPVFLLRLVRDRTWKVCGVGLNAAARLDDEHLKLLNEEIEELAKRPEPPTARTKTRPEIACLFDPDDEMAPSTRETLDRFSAAAQRQGANFSIIGRGDTHRLGEFDALFVRTLTGLDKWSFAVQQKAAALKMPVIDDPLSTIRCSNKIFLFEMLQRLCVAQPRAQVVTQRTPLSALEPFGFPLIVKLPDGSFSKAVKKVKTPAEYEEWTARYFKKSPLLLVQEYVPSEYDWRVGVLGGRVLYACRYYMAKGHWQILKTDEKGQFSGSGKVEAIPRDTLDPAVRDVALAAARAIGNGLYGVDIKETSNGPVIIEINDNPNIDEGNEDHAEKSRVYDEVIEWFLTEIRADVQEAAQETKSP